MYENAGKTQFGQDNALFASKANTYQHLLNIDTIKIVFLQMNVTSSLSQLKNSDQEPMDGCIQRILFYNLCLTRLC